MLVEPNWNTAIEAMIHAKERHKLTGKFRGRFPCKVCGKGMVHWRIEPDKKRHSRGACDTTGCISWIE